MLCWTIPYLVRGFSYVKISFIIIVELPIYSCDSPMIFPGRPLETLGLPFPVCPGPAPSGIAIFRLPVCFTSSIAIFGRHPKNWASWFLFLRRKFPLEDLQFIILIGWPWSYESWVSNNITNPHIWTFPTSSGWGTWSTCFNHIDLIWEETINIFLSFQWTRVHGFGGFMSGDVRIFLMTFSVV